MGSIHSTLYWDQNTQMPLNGADWRGEQLGLVTKYLHDRQTSEIFEDLLNQAKFEIIDRFDDISSDIEVNEKFKNIELLEMEFKRQKNQDPVLVVNIAMEQARGYNLWQEAKIKDDFSLFAPALKNLIFLRREQARQIDSQRSYWETLAQPFEPGITKDRLKHLFSPLRRKIPLLIDRSLSYQSRLLKKWDLPASAQEILCDELLQHWGRKKQSTCYSQSPHPFSITLGPNDYRITTRIVPGQPLSCFLATAHEWGHSLYEQGLPDQTHQWFAWPLGQATSMGLHESQSLFWENRVARSRAFSKRFWKKFAELGAPFKSEVDLWREMNPLKPGLNRVEADELSYALHIMIRTELEFALVEEGLEVEDLPNEWNKKYKEFISLDIKTDREGCLQDVHWSEGQFGYFPSYLLGHLISAQISEAMGNCLKSFANDRCDPIDSLIELGQEKEILKWLRSEVHPIGRKMNAEELVKKVTGKDLSSDIFLQYLEEKVQKLIEAS